MSKLYRHILYSLFCLIFLGAQNLLAHVPILERIDYSEIKPATIEDISISQAYYAYLDSSRDIDYYTFSINGPQEIYIEQIVPACVEYTDFQPSFALIGPGLPLPDDISDLPVQLPSGYGALIFHDSQLPEEREIFYEPFGGKSYFSGPKFLSELTVPGEYTVIFWDIAGQKGDYVGVFGIIEEFSGVYLESLKNTTLIRRDRELHLECTPLE